VAKAPGKIQYAKVLDGDPDEFIQAGLKQGV
jgi:hypothetical protein